MHPKTVPLVDDHCGEGQEGQLLTRETLRPDWPRRTYFICAEDIFGKLRSGRRATTIDDGDVEEWGRGFVSLQRSFGEAKVRRRLTRSTRGFCAGDDLPRDGTYIPISALARDKMLLG